MPTVAPEMRLYLRESDSFGPDGYPVAWHEIKHLVRETAGHRCVRCLHPYRTAESPPEWSPCDERCRHAGPVRVMTTKGWRDFDPKPGSPGIPGLRSDYPGAPIEARWRILTVHHLDGDKANLRWWNLVALCQRDHLYIQGKVVMDRAFIFEHSAWFKSYAAGFYAWKYLGEDLSREEAAERQDELLALERLDAARSA